jgi:hypothetical protein
MISVIVSPTQSGKTKYIQDLSFSSLSDKKSVFIVLRNITADMLQFCRRWNFPTPLNCYNSITENPYIYICLSNVQQLSKMYCTIERINHDFIIILDEADLIYIDKKDCKQSTILYDEMYKNEHLNHKYYITATPFSLFKYVPNIKCQNVYSLEKKECYVGFDKIKKWHILGNSVKRLTKLDKAEEYCSVYMELLNYVLKRDSHQIVLFNCTSLIILQEKIGKDFFTNNDINVIIDHGEYTTLYTKDSIPVYTREEFKYQFKKIHIKDILKNLKIYSSSKKIVIVSGIKAGRGQSYKTEDKNEWHLTDLVYLPPVFQTCETLIQACGRITGIYEKNHQQLHIWTSRKAKDSILEYISYQNTVLKQCKSYNGNVADITESFKYSGSFKIC